VRNIVNGLLIREDLVVLTRRSGHRRGVQHAAPDRLGCCVTRVWWSCTRTSGDLQFHRRPRKGRSPICDIGLADDAAVAQLTLYIGHASKKRQAGGSRGGFSLLFAIGVLD
jgi:hypothetical protein